MCARARGVGGRRISRQQEYCLLKMRSEDGNCMPFSDSFKPMLALFARESRELAIGGGAIRYLHVIPHMVAYGSLASQGCHT